MITYPGSKSTWIILPCHVVAIFSTDPDIDFTSCGIYRSLAIHWGDRCELSPGLCYNSCTPAQSQYIEGHVTNGSISIASGNFVVHQNGNAFQSYKIYLAPLATQSLPYYHLTFPLGPHALASHYVWIIATRSTLSTRPKYLPKTVPLYYGPFIWWTGGTSAVCTQGNDNRNG